MRGYRFTPPLLAPAARVNSSQRSPISNRRSFSTPHPGLLRRLRWLDRLSQKLELFCAGSLRISRPKQSPPRARRHDPASANKKLPILIWPPKKSPKTPPSAPTHPDGQQRTVKHVPAHRSRRKNPFHPKKESAAATETPTKAPRADAARARAIAPNQAVHRGPRPRARGSPHNQGKPIWPRRPHRPRSRRSSRAAWPRAVSTN